MEYALSILMPFVSLLVGYILSGIPTAIIVGKVFFNQDPRQYGSHNPGGTNATRLWGKKVGYTVIALDMIKSIVPFWIMFIVYSFTPLKTIMFNDAIQWGIWMTALGSVLGHCYSIFLKFKGGKGVSTYIGSLGSSSWLQLIIGLVDFLGLLFWKKIVGLSSICMSLIAMLISWIMYFISFNPNCFETVSNLFIFNPDLININIAYPIIVSLMTLIVILRHKENIKRIVELHRSKDK